MAKKFIKKCAACVKFLKIRPMLLFFGRSCCLLSLALHDVVLCLRKLKLLMRALVLALMAINLYITFQKSGALLVKPRRVSYPCPTLSYLIVANLPI